MQAGKLRFLITIEENAGLGTASGSQKPVWTKICEDWADIIPLSGRALMTAQAVMTEISVRIEMRYRSEITAAMRVVYGGTVYKILTPPLNVRNRNRELHLMCAAGITKG